jgi:hypothetical protein
MRGRLCATALAGAFLALAAPAQSAAPAAVSASSPYAPYAFLIGAWDVAPENGPAFAVTRFTWGPNQSYIWFSTSLLENGREAPHFEGMLMWNGMRRNLDMLVALDLNGGRAQEQGTVSIDAEGVVVRDHISISSDSPGRPAGTAHFRQTFKAVGPDRLLTSILRETDKGWVANFPGGDRAVMTRRAAPA